MTAPTLRSSTPTRSVADSKPPRAIESTARCVDDLNALVAEHDDEIGILVRLRENLAALLHGAVPVADAPAEKQRDRPTLGLLAATDRLREQHGQRSQLVLELHNLVHG